MATSFETNTKVLLGFWQDAYKLYEKYVDELLEYNKSKDEVNFTICPATEDFVRYANDKIYDYLINSKGLINAEFNKNVNYYQNVIVSEDFYNLTKDLYNNITAIYSLLDRNVIVNEKNKSNYEFFKRFIKPIEAINPENALQNVLESFETLLDILEVPLNFQQITFDELCDEYFYIKVDNTGYKETNLFNINNVIEQYEALILPLDEAFLNRNKLIPQMARFLELKQNYETNIKQLKTILTADFENKKRYYFYLFKKLVNCRYGEKYCAESDEGIPFKCNECRESVLVVLLYLINYARNPEEANLTAREKDVLDLLLQGHSNIEIAEKNVVTDDTLSKQIKSICNKMNFTNDNKKVKKIDIRQHLFKFYS